MSQTTFFRRFSIHVLLLLALSLLFSACAGGNNDPSDARSAGVPHEISIISEVVSIPEEPTAYITCTEEALHRGDLILVNHTYAYDPSLCAKEITNVRDARASDIQEGSYRLPIGNHLLQTLEAMQADMQHAMNDRVCLLVNDSYRSAEDQQATIDEYLALYGQAYVDQYVAPVRRSEHHTALAADLSFISMPVGTVMATTSAEAAAHYAWLLENCRKYGLILRYTVEKEAITGYRAESWHFRYVGRPHADYIAANGLALEEYLDRLKTTSYAERLSIETDDGMRYSVYYVAATADGTQVPVPETKPYTISGNNMDGFIVTVDENG